MSFCAVGENRTVHGKPMNVWVEYTNSAQKGPSWPPGSKPECSYCDMTVMFNIHWLTCAPQKSKGDIIVKNAIKHFLGTLLV